MKQLLFTLAIVGMGLSLVSCDQFYFSTPQPIDAKNIYEFPNEARGSWTDNGDSIIVGRKNFISVEYSEKKIAKSEVKSSSRYKLKRDKIYITDTEKGLKGRRGFPYSLKDDTLYYKEAEVFELALGDETFLRKGEQVYILNTKHGKNWYEIFLIELEDPETTITRYLKADDLNKIKDLKRLHVTHNQYFLEASWTKKDLTALLQKGVFSDTILVLNRKKH